MNISDDLVNAFNDGYARGKANAEAYMLHYGDELPITNADRIRSMGDEELAYWYFNEFFRKVPYCRKEECYEDSPCEECLLEWLKEKNK